MCPSVWTSPQGGTGMGTSMMRTEMMTGRWVAKEDGGWVPCPAVSADFTRIVFTALPPVDKKEYGIALFLTAVLQSPDEIPEETRASATQRSGRVRFHTPS